MLCRQANWKLDPPLRKACRGDVQQLCAEEDAKNSEEGLVYKCLVKNVGQISTGCQKVGKQELCWYSEQEICSDGGSAFSRIIV
jgi:hypothetical protein